MAKKHQRSTKLPKRIAGVKVPKALRKSGGKLVGALTHPLIADVAAAALVAVATALRDSEAARNGSNKAEGRGRRSSRGSRGKSSGSNS